MKVIYNSDGSRTWVAIDNMTQEQKKQYDGQRNRPSEAQLKEREASHELRVLMTSPSQFKKYLNQKKRNK